MFSSLNMNFETLGKIQNMYKTLYNIKNFNQNTKFKPHWHFSVFLKTQYFFFSSSSTESFQSALFKTKRRCFFDALNLAALYEQVNKVAPLNAAWLGSHSGT